MPKQLRKVSIHEIDDMPPCRFEVSWTDKEGESFSVEVETLDEVLEIVREQLAEDRRDA